MRDHFLLGLLLGELVLLSELAGNGASPVQGDPVCGLVIDPDADTPTVEEHHVRYAFCSNSADGDSSCAALPRPRPRSSLTRPMYELMSRFTLD